MRLTNKMSLAHTVMINDLNKAELFVALYNKAKVFNKNAVVVISRGQAEAILREQQIFSKLNGKRMYIDLRRDDKMMVYYYNKYNGVGAAQHVIRNLRRGSNTRLQKQANDVIYNRRSVEPPKQNIVRDFIPNPISPSQQTSQTLGEKRMNQVVTSSRSRKIVDPSKITNAATVPIRGYTNIKKIQIINTRKTTHTQPDARKPKLHIEPMEMTFDEYINRDELPGELNDEQNNELDDEPTGEQDGELDDLDIEEARLIKRLREIEKVKETRNLHKMEQREQREQRDQIEQIERTEQIGNKNGEGDEDEKNEKENQSWKKEPPKEPLSPQVSRQINGEIKKIKAAEETARRLLDKERKKQAKNNHELHEIMNNNTKIESTMNNDNDKEIEINVGNGIIHEDVTEILSKFVIDTAVDGEIATTGTESLFKRYHKKPKPRIAKKESIQAAPDDVGYKLYQQRESIKAEREQQRRQSSMEHLTREKQLQKEHEQHLRDQRKPEQH